MTDQTPAEPLSAEDIRNLEEVIESQVRLGHVMTLVPTDVLVRTLDAARARPSDGLRGAAIWAREYGDLLAGLVFTVPIECRQVDDTCVQHNAEWSTRHGADLGHCEWIEARMAVVPEWNGANVALRAALEASATGPTIEQAVESIERAAHPRGGCTECGGGEFYWKHYPGDPLTGHHLFQATRPLEATGEGSGTK